MLFFVVGVVPSSVLGHQARRPGPLVMDLQPGYPERMIDGDDSIDVPSCPSLTKRVADRVLVAQSIWRPDLLMHPMFWRNNREIVRHVCRQHPPHPFLPE